MFACASGHRARILGPAVDCPLDCLGVRSIALTERFVAFEAFDNGTRDASDYDRVVVVDLQSGSSRVADAGGHTRFAGDPPYKPPAPGSVTDLVLNVNGHVAWISQDDSGQSRTYLVRTRSAGKAVTLASGPGIQPGSLAAAGARVYWTQDGVARSALSASR
jgi:hypothetical protein